MQRKNRVLNEKVAELARELESSERKQGALNRDLQQAKTQLTDAKQNLTECKATAESADQVCLESRGHNLFSLLYKFYINCLLETKFKFIVCL